MTEDSGTYKHHGNESHSEAIKLETFLEEVGISSTDLASQISVLSGDKIHYTTIYRAVKAGKDLVDLPLTAMQWLALCEACRIPYAELMKRFAAVYESRKQQRRF